MWVLTVMLLMYSGELHAYQFGTYVWQIECQAAGDDALKLREAGLHVISTTCDRVKEA